MVERFHPSAKGMIAKVVIGALALSVLIVLGKEILGNLFLLAGAGVWGIAILLALLARGVHLFKTIEIGENNVKLLIGVMNRQSTIIPYNRVTHVRTTHTLFQRVLGLGTLEIDTAGSDMVEVRLADIPNKYLEQILKNLEEKTHGRAGVT